MENKDVDLDHSDSNIKDYKGFLALSYVIKSRLLRDYCQREFIEFNISLIYFG